MAVRIFCASTCPIFHFGFVDSSSDPEDPALSAGVTSEELLSTALSVLGRGTLFISISRKGELSESDEKFVSGGAASGEPSAFFDRKPVWNLLFRDLGSVDASGGVGIGDEELRLAPSVNTGGGGIGSAEETSGVVSIALGVAS